MEKRLNGSTNFIGLRLAKKSPGIINDEQINDSSESCRNT